MMDATATLDDVTSFDGRVLPSVAAACLIITTIAVTTAWMINTAFSINPHIHAKASMELGTLVLAQHETILANAQVSADPAGAPDVAFDARWTDATAFAPASAVPVVPQRSVAPDETFEARWVRASDSAPASVVLLVPQFPIERANNVPSPPPASTPEKRVTPQQAYNKPLQLPEVGSRTAIYDIAASTVYLPNGDRLEAHSGLGDKLDDPRYINVKMRGPTPPNVYELALREQLFHGVRAIRLNPVDDGKMFGRDGMLAHTYMLGANGQSNGCVSFRDYQKFLQAFLRGEVERLVVVTHLGDAPLRTARVGRGLSRQYASNNQ